jgi:hypothetical protein
MRLNCGEGNGASLAGRTSRNTARTARIIDNMVICRTFWRSVFFITTTRGDGYIDRSRGYRPRIDRQRSREFAGLSFSAQSPRSVRSVS